MSKAEMGDMQTLIADTHMALNHSSRDITDTYIKTDWAIIDRANRKVIDYLNLVEKAAA